MNAVDWRAGALRFLVLVLFLLAAVGVLVVVFYTAGRPLRPAISAGAGVVGFAMAMLGIGLLAWSRRGSERVTGATAFGAMALSVPFLVAALVV
ncbi:MAG: hypothetical protein EXQ67_04445 [Thermoleophilia bacterium]|nr:hypothetical protein [Thermoleophilia bacterium]